MTDRKIRVLALPRYCRAGASSRVRLYQFGAYLSSRSIDLTVYPLLDERYVRGMLAGRRRAYWHLLTLYADRVYQLLKKDQFDVVWIEKELLPWAPQLLDPGLLGSRPYVVDYDDAIFHNYDEHPSGILNWAYRGKIPEIMRGAVTVVAGNPYLRDFAVAAGAKNIEIIPSTVDEVKFKPKPRMKSQSAGFIVGWIGSPSTQYLLEPIAEVLASELTSPRDRFVTIGARFSKPLFSSHVSLAWNEVDEADLIAGFDVGLMPLNDAPFERGKCGFKLVQYMACGVPMIASPVGVNSLMVRSGSNGFLAASESDWRFALKTLKSSSSLRSRMGVTARSIFESDYAFSVHAPRFAKILSDAASKS